MTLFGTKAWAKQTLKADGVKKISVAKRPKRLANTPTIALYQEIIRRDLVQTLKLNIYMRVAKGFDSLQHAFLFIYSYYIVYVAYYFIYC